MLKIIKEVGFISPHYVGILENGVHVYALDGRGVDKEGNIYKSVFAIDEDDLVQIGWVLQDKDNPIEEDSVVLEDYVLSEEEKPKEMPKKKFKKAVPKKDSEKTAEKPNKRKIEMKPVWKNDKIFFEEFEKIED